MLEIEPRMKKDKYETPEVVELGLAEEIVRGNGDHDVEINGRSKGIPALEGPEE